MRKPGVVPAALLAVLLAHVLAACGGGGASGPPAYLPPYAPGSLPALKAPGTPVSARIASYRIDARLDTESKQLTATSTLTWKHTGTQPVSEVPLHLYMNAFKNQTSVFMKESGGKHRGARATKRGWGWIEVPSIRQGAAELRAGARFGEDETVLWVPLATPVAPGGELVLDFSFTVQLPEVFARTGYKHDFFMIGQWFPKIGVLERGAPGEAERFYCHTFHLSSEFFADFGTYDVTLDVPASHVIAATGVLTAASEEGGRRKTTWRAEDVHDFAWMADPKMRVIETTSENGVKVLVYFRPEQAAFAPRHLEAAKRTIETFSRLFVEYPWSVMTVIAPPPAADGSAGGMEYPTLVTTAGDRAFLPAGVRAPEFVTIHEVGHNWFQGILATNEAEEAWMDEGINTWADGIVLEEWYGADRGMLDWGGFRLGPYQVDHLAYDPADDIAAIATRSWDFPSNGDYSEASYNKTSVALKTLEHMVGRERFFAAMRVYTQRWAFKHPRRADFYAALSEGLGSDHGWYLVPAFETPGSAELVLERVRTRPAHAPRGVFGDGEDRRTVDDEDAPDSGWVSSALVKNTGGVPVTTEVRFRFADGSEQRVPWDGRGAAFAELEVTSKSPLVEVTVDPDRKVLLEGNAMDNAVRLTAEYGASWRAAGRMTFWQQTLMQLGGF